MNTRALIRIAYYLSLLVGVIALPACTTILSGKKGDEGLQYYLPAPHIVMSPQSDGTVKVEVKYIADPNHAYTLKLHSYFSSATFEVKTTAGLLDSVALDTDASAIASKSIAAATDLQNKKMEKEEADRVAKKQKDDAEKAELKAENSEMKSLQDEISLTEDKLKVYQGNSKIYNASQIAEVQLQLSQQKKKLELKKANAKAPVSSAFNDPSVTNGVQKSFGPVFFRVLPEGKGVKLVAEKQNEEIITSIEAVDQQAGAIVAFSPSSIVVSSKDVNKPVMFKSNLPVEIDPATVMIVDPNVSMTTSVVEGNQISIKSDETKTSFTLVVPANLKRGTYIVTFDYRTDGLPIGGAIDLDWGK